MPSPAPEIVQLINVFAIAFTAPTWRNASVLLYGAILTPGRCTVSSALRVMGLGDEPRFEKYHRVLNRNRWEALLLGRLLLGLIIKLCVSVGAPLLLVVDETLERRWGAKITNLSKYRDPVRSSKKGVVYTTGVRWLCLAIIVSVPWNRRGWALPFMTIPLLSPNTSAKLGKRHRTSVDRAGQLISLVRRWYPQRELIIMGDGGFAAVALVQHCQRKHIGVTLISRIRLDARLFDPPGPQPPGKRGKKPKKGERQPRLAERLHDASTEWLPCQVLWYGGKARTLEITTGTSLWHRTGLDPVPIRWVLVRCPEDDTIKPAAFFSSDPNRAAQDIVHCFILRWHIEVTFEEVRMHLGFETQRQWSDKAMARTSPALLGLYSLLVLIAITLHPQQLPIQRTTWYDKKEATFSDVLFAVRLHLWGFEQFNTSSVSAHSILIPRQLLAALRQIALYSV